MMSSTFISVDEQGEGISLQLRVSVDTKIATSQELEIMFNNVAYKFKQFLIMLNYVNK